MAKRISNAKAVDEFTGFDLLHIETNDDVPTHRIIRGAPDKFESKAVAIAKKYGVI